jgi:hypothetical protein
MFGQQHHAAGDEQQRRGKREFAGPVGDRRQLHQDAARRRRGRGRAGAGQGDNVYTIDNLQCADGWAVTSGVLASTQNPTMGAPTSFVFRRDGEVWVGQDKAKVCGTNPTTTTPPADAAIPAALFLSGCAAG